MHLRPQFKSNSSSHTHDSNLCRIYKDNSDVRSFLTRLSVYPICVPLCNQALADPAYRAKQIAGMQRAPRDRVSGRQRRRSRGAKPSAPRRRMKWLEDQGAVQRGGCRYRRRDRQRSPARSIQVDPWGRETPDINLLGWLLTHTAANRPGTQAFQLGSKVRTWWAALLGSRQGAKTHSPSAATPRGLFPARGAIWDPICWEGSLQGEPPLGVLGSLGGLLEPLKCSIG